MDSAALQLGAAAVQKKDPPPSRVAAIATSICLDARTSAAAAKAETLATCACVVKLQILALPN